MTVRITVTERFANQLTNLIAAAGALVIIGGGFMYMQYNNLSSFCSSVQGSTVADSGTWDLPDRCANWALRSDVGVGLMVLGLAGIGLAFVGGRIYRHRVFRHLRP